MKRTSLVLALAQFGVSAFAADPSPSDEACRANLRQLSAGIESYHLLFEKNPTKLSDLFTEGIVDDLRIFVCPASPTKKILAVEIDAKSDYTLGEPGKEIVRERAAFHANGERLAMLADGTITVIGGTAATPATTSPTKPASPPLTQPTTPTIPQAPRPRMTAREILAAERGETDEVRTLVAGNDPNARDTFVQRTAFAWTIVLDDRVAFTRLLAVPGADVNAVDGRDETPLLLAAQAAMNHDMTPVAEALIAKGANVGIEGMGVTPLMLAANSNAPGVARAILSKLPPGEIDTHTPDGTTALIMGASVGAVEIVRLLLEKGAAIEGADKHGTTPLMFAVSHAFPQTTETVKLLLEKGANANARDNDGHTPLSEALRHARPEVVALLRKAGAK